MNVINNDSILCELREMIEKKQLYENALFDTGIKIKQKIFEAGVLENYRDIAYL